MNVGVEFDIQTNCPAYLDILYPSLSHVKPSLQHVDYAVHNIIPKHEHMHK